MRQERRDEETRHLETTTQITTQIIGGVSAHLIFPSDGKGVDLKQEPGDFRLDPPPPDPKS